MMETRMRVLQIIPDRATLYGEKCSLIDRQHLSRDSAMEVTVFRQKRQTLHRADPEESLVEFGTLGQFDIVHLYDADRIAPSVRRRIPPRHVADARGRRSRLPWRSIPDPRVLIRPVESVKAPEEGFFLAEPIAEELLGASPAGLTITEHPAVGCVRRQGPVERMTNAIRIRLERFRDDLEWTLFDRLPSRADLRRVSVWIDVATDPDDRDGGAAEAAAAGIPVVASRLPLNEWRLSGGETGFLVRPGDANEFAHVILIALFKPEVTAPRVRRAVETRERFSPVRRAAELSSLYRHMVERS